MHTQLKAVFDEHDNASHASKRDVHDQLAPILAIATAVQRQVLEYKSLLMQAELADHDHALDGKIEHMRQTFAAAEREANAFMEHGRNLAQCFTQLDRYMADAQSGVETIMARRAAETA